MEKKKMFPRGEICLKVRFTLYRYSLSSSWALVHTTVVLKITVTFFIAFFMRRILILTKQFKSLQLI